MKGVYKITNTENGKVYIGSSSRIQRRWTEHKSLLNSQKHFNKHLQNAWNSYGGSAFVFQVLEICDNYLDKEAEFIKKLKSLDKKFGYNRCVVSKPRLGVKTSSTTKKKLSVALSGEKHPNWGKKIPRVSVLKMIDAQTGVSKPNSGRDKSYKVISPEKEVVEFTGLRKFCREHGFTISGFWSMVSGRNKSYKGWTST